MSFAKKIFSWVTRWPKLTASVGLLVVVVAASRLPLLVKDVRPDAFLAEDNPSLVYRDIVKDMFGLSDPLVIAVVAEGEEGVFTPEILRFVARITRDVSGLPNINSTRVVSLSTENNIQSSADGMDIVPFLEPMPSSLDSARAVRQQIENFPLYAGKLVSSDGSATLIIAEMSDEGLAEGSYQAVRSLFEGYAVPSGVSLHVAGEGAVSGYMGRYLDADAQRLVPFAALAITLILFLAYRRLSPALMCDLVMIATVVITLGTMASLAVPFYIITAALPVILIGISVADGIHIYSHYFELQQQSDSGTQIAPDNYKGLVVATMLAMWRPISLTSLTTVAGFLGLYFAAAMPPFKYFGLFAAFGVAVAWLYSLLFLPAVLVLTRPKQLSNTLGHPGAASEFMSRMGRFTLNHSRLVLLFFSFVLVAGAIAASQLQVDDNPIGIFHPDEPIAVADRAINEHTTGSNTLDIVIETREAEALFDPAKLMKIEQLQKFAQNLPYVGGSVSIVDYLKQMNRAMHEGDSRFYVIPATRELVAQYFLVYAALSDPTDFEEEVDYDYQMANIRVQIKSGGYRDTRPVLESLQAYITDQFNGPDMTATLSGRVNLNYHWIKDLASSHFTGMIIALLLVWLVSTVLFQSVLAGFYTLIPVAGSVLGVYAIMVLTGITLGMETAMFAAIAIGLGIDFAIHTLDRLIVLSRKYSGNLEAAFEEFFPSTGKALLFNFLAIACGFGVLLVSNIMSLKSFGGIVMLSIGISFVASMTLLPALIWHMRPAFLFVQGSSSPSSTLARMLGVAFFGLALTFFLMPAAFAAQESIAADEIVRRVNEVEQGDYIRRNLTMEMIDRHGKTRQRETIGYRRNFFDQKKTVIFYLAPSNIRGTAFLTWDYLDATKEDDQWLYLPALRKVRRISAGDRGDYFLGTDFTYDDIKQDGKLSTADFDYSLADPAQEEQGDFLDYEHFVLEAEPRTNSIANELGYSRSTITIDARNWVVRRVEYWDLKGQHLKTLEASDVRQVQGLWTRHVLTMENYQTGHTTKLVLSKVDYTTPVKESLFTRQALTRGH